MGATCPIIKTLENTALQWYNNFYRMVDDGCPKQMLRWVPQGRPVTEWASYFKDAIMDTGLYKRDWNEKNFWSLKTKKNTS